METQTFTPDADYCVYCHAPAAGPCAECGALCCGDCVEVVLQLTTHRAVCKSCLAGREDEKHGWSGTWIAGVGALIAALAWLLYATLS